MLRTHQPNNNEHKCLCAVYGVLILSLGHLGLVIGWTCVAHLILDIPWSSLRYWYSAVLHTIHVVVFWPTCQRWILAYESAGCLCATMASALLVGDILIYVSWDTVTSAVQAHLYLGPLFLFCIFVWNVLSIFMWFKLKQIQSDARMTEHTRLLGPDIFGDSRAYNRSYLSSGGPVSRPVSMSS